jgi:hypothetical protein
VVGEDTGAATPQQDRVLRRRPIRAPIDEGGQVRPPFLVLVKPLERHRRAVGLGRDHQRAFVGGDRARHVAQARLQHLGGFQQRRDRPHRIVGLGRRGAQHRHELVPAPELPQQLRLRVTGLAVPRVGGQRALVGGQGLIRTLELLLFDARDLSPDPRRPRCRARLARDAGRLPHQLLPCARRARVRTQLLPEVVVRGQQAQHHDARGDGALGGTQALAKDTRHLAQRGDLLVTIVLQVQSSQQQLDQAIPTFFIAQRGLGPRQHLPGLWIGWVARPAIQPLVQIDLGVGGGQVLRDRGRDPRHPRQRFGGALATGKDLEAGAQRPDQLFGVGVGLPGNVEEQIVRSAPARPRRQPRRQPRQIRIAGAEAQEHQGAPLLHVIEPGQPGRRNQAHARVRRTETEALG